jgi:glycosyltransferase involved in cell wall biosynthesis
MVQQSTLERCCPLNNGVKRAENGPPEWLIKFVHSLYPIYLDLSFPAKPTISRVFRRVSWLNYCIIEYQNAEISSQFKVNHENSIEHRKIYHLCESNKAKPNLLIIVHEAERTGAPVLGLNLAKKLSNNFNVVIFLLDSKGDLLTDFLNSGAVCVVAADVRGNLKHAHTILEKIIGECDSFQFAIVNSLESSLHVLPILAKYKILALNLIHEFSSCYANRFEMWRFLTDWPGINIFSTKLTKEDALKCSSSLWLRKNYIVPQGVCVPPSTKASDNVTAKSESEAVLKLMRPEGSGPDLRVVVGLGSVHIRKGVDLFIQVASFIKSLDKANKYRFVWFGKNYEENLNWGYDVFLKDQIIRSGLCDDLVIAKETSAIEAVYKNMDFLALTSRLDPLPNVAIDAWLHGVPVMCFDGTTGIAEHLMGNDLGEACVSPYLDAKDMATKIVQLNQDGDKLGRVKNIISTIPEKDFNFDSYVDKILEIVRKFKEQSNENLSLLNGLSGCIDESYFFIKRFQDDLAIFNPGVLTNINESFISSWTDTRLLRKPIPSFNPAIYAEDNLGINFFDPYSHYLRMKNPQGRWSSSIISPVEVDLEKVPISSEVAIHFHVHYPDLVKEFLEYLSFNTIKPDLFISATSQEVAMKTNELVKNYSGSFMVCVADTNRGRDISPFISGEISKAIFGRYKYIGHFHTKKSLHVEPSLGNDWRKFILTNLLGKKGVPMADVILSNLKDNPKLGLVFPSDPNVIGWDKNYDYAKNLANKMQINNLPLQFNFPIGTMFWMKHNALDPLLHLNLPIDTFPEEPAPIDGSALHAIERLIPLIAEKAGYSYAETYVPGVTR